MLERGALGLIGGQAIGGCDLFVLFKGPNGVIDESFGFLACMGMQEYVSVVWRLQWRSYCIFRSVSVYLDIFNVGLLQ